MPKIKFAITIMFSCVSNIFLFACKNSFISMRVKNKLATVALLYSVLFKIDAVCCCCYTYIHSDLSTYRTSNASASITKWVWRMTLAREGIHFLSLYMVVRMYIGDRRRYKRVKHGITTVHNDGNGTVVCLFT